ncbi:MAG: 50S ribosomal protein L10 [Candidatus Omnitrophica bacterium]|nr:50S ribosomal protein L10 [Candidatus Omnitrophota bacterium]
MEKVGKVLRASLHKGIKDGIQNNQAVFMLSYSAISSSQMGILRKSLSKVGAQVHVPQNRIAKLVLKELKNEALADKIKGQTAFVWSNSDAVSVSKTLVKFTDQFKSIVINGGLLDGETLIGGDVKRLSDLPAKEVLQAQLLQVMLAPMTRFAGLLNAKSRDLLSILKQYGEKKGGN